MSASTVTSTSASDPVVGTSLFASAIAPSLLSELLCGLDWLALRCSPVYGGRGLQHGRGAPVVVVPGFLVDDSALVELHDWLGRVGYRPYYSGIGLHARCGDQLIGRLTAVIERA